MRNASNSGFTLIEMLVVLVIVSLTTTLLMTGLSTTWRNFERLGVRDLTVSAGQLGSAWFRQSFQGAVMYHPFKSDFKGDENRIQMISFNAPFDLKQAPQQLAWIIRRSSNDWQLVLIDMHNNTDYLIKQFQNQPRFEYLSASGWTTSFTVKRNAIPKAIRILVDNDEWLRVYPQRPLQSDMPVEYPPYGVYEF